MTRPNIILIFADDLGYGDLGCEGGKVIRTPHLDRMAAEGTRLTDFYASANICTPSRAGLMTGQFAIRNGLAHEVIQAADSTGLPPDAFTIPRLLKTAGYATALIGKWHLGHVAPHWPPTLYGFDTFKGLPYSHDMRPLSYFEADGAEITLTEDKVDFTRLTERFFAETLAFAGAHKDGPFAIVLALTAPHVPLRPHESSDGTSLAGAYGEVVEEIDRNVGALLAALADMGLEGNTLVAFTSDNGPWFEGSSGPFRDRKGGGAWEGGFRVPCILRQPGVIPAGQACSGLTSNLDFLPTFAALTGTTAAIPAGHDLDGVDLSGLILRGEPSPRDEIVLFNNTKVAAVRAGRWKFVGQSYYRGLDIDLAAYRYPLLFDLATDPGETYSVAARHPEVMQAMAARYEAAKAKFAPMAAKSLAHVPPPGAENHPD